MPAARRPAARGRVRIIGGVWRRRIVEFPPRPDLRPTPDRVRETLFNWLAPVLPGARCLDLFAGSGVLGFEALSRGAAGVVFVDPDPMVLSALQDSRARLAADSAEIVRGGAIEFLNGPVDPFDIVFVDPPYTSDLLDPALALLAEHGWVRDGGRVYIEARKGKEPHLPAGWALVRSKTAGQVGYHLAATAMTEETV